ncbi:hypothetical protein Tco_0352343 [Tanacetum coccineum]
MVAVNDVPQLVDKKGGSYTAIPPKLEPGKFNKWKKRMLCYLARMEPYYLKCIKDGPFQPKIAEGDAKPESQWTLDERTMVVQDQRLKSIIMSCLPDDIMESVISCVFAKKTWTDLVYSFEGQPNPKKDFQENSDDEVDERSSEEYLRDLDIEYHERALLANSKHFIKRRNNFSAVKSNENTDMIQIATKGQSPLKVSHRPTPAISLLNKLANDGVNLSKHEINDFQENSDDEVEERCSKEYLRDLDIEYHEKALLANSKHYKAEYKKIKAKLALLEASPSSSQNPKTFQPKNKGLVDETFDWDEEDISDEEEVTQVKVLMALADDELTVGKSHARNGEWVNITIRKVNTLLSMDEDADWQNYLKDELLILKQAKLDAVTFQIQNSKLTKLNHALQEQLKKEKKINEKWITSSKKGASPSSDVMPLTFKPHSPREKPGLVPTEDKDTEQESKINELTQLVQMLIDEKRHIKEPIWYLDNGYSRSMTDVKSYLHKYVEQLGPKDHLGKFDAKADDGYFLGYSFISKAFRVFNIRRQQVDETYHVTFNESMEAIRFTNTLVDEIEIDDSSRYPPDEFLQEDDPSR